MKEHIIILYALLMGPVIAPAQDPPMPHDAPEWWTESMKSLDDRMQWWEECRFALFIHWGPSAVLGGEYKDTKRINEYSEQMVKKARIPLADYTELAASKFQPEKFDAEEWVLLAKNAGMKYLVITAKHHDGFGIWHSRYSDFDMDGTAKWERDPLKELSDSCRKHGIVFGTYYSHMQDWYHPYNVGNDWDYEHPVSPNWYHKDTPEVRDYTDKVEKHYIDAKSIPQTLELIRDYGSRLMWFDTATWMPLKLRLKVLRAAREAAPDLVVSPRAAGGFGATGNYGDFIGGPDAPAVFPCYKSRYWEAIRPTTAHSWGYNKFDQENRLSPQRLLRMLAMIVSKGGNFMVNIGPKGDGSIPEGDKEILRYFADWMKPHSESIHGADRTPLPAQNWGVVTAKGNALYLHVFDYPKNGKLWLGGLAADVKSATILNGNIEIPVRQECGNAYLLKLPKEESKPSHCVIRVNCADTPKGDGYRLLDPDTLNRLHAYDYAEAFGNGLRPQSSKNIDAYFVGWKDSEAKLVWKVRQRGEQKYNVQLLYDIPKTGKYDDSYQVTVGDHVLVGAVNRKGTGDLELIDAEKQLTRLDEVWESKMKTQMIVDGLGEILLKEGTYDLELRAAGKIKSGELLRPRAIFLIPVE